MRNSLIYEIYKAVIKTYKVVLMRNKVTNVRYEVTLLDIKLVVSFFFFLLIYNLLDVVVRYEFTMQDIKSHCEI